MKWLAALVLPLALLALVVACEEEEEEAVTATPSPAATVTGTAEPTPSPEATSTLDETRTPEPSPTPEGLACAAGSTQRFLEVQQQAGFVVYCPTFLPEEFQLEEVTYQPVTWAPDVTPPAGAEGRGQVHATFVEPSSGASVMLFQGNVGASFTGAFWRLADEEGISPETIAYGNLEGSLIAPITTLPDVSLGAWVMSGMPDNGQILTAEEVAVDTVKEIAAGMLPVEELP